MDKIHYYIDSHFCEAGGVSHDFKFKLDLPDRKDLSVVVLSATVAKSYYTIRSPYNSFSIVESGTSATVTIPEGNYEARSFPTVLVPLINAASPNHLTYAMTLNLTTGKYAYTCTGPSNFQFTALGVSEQMGFAGVSTQALPTTSSQMVNFQNVPAVYIKSNLASEFGDSKTADILQDVTAGGPDYSTLTYRCTNVNLYAKKLTNPKGGAYQFTITDTHGRSLNLNGGDVTITLLVFNNSEDLMKDYVAWQMEETDKKTNDGYFHVPTSKQLDEGKSTK